VTRLRSILLGVTLGGVVGAVILALLLWVTGDGDAPPAEASASSASAPAEEPASGEAEAVPSGPMVKMQPVTIYQRAATAEVALVGVPAQIVWLESPIERARQIVRIALEGTDQTRIEAYPPTVRPLEFRDVFIDDRGIAWVDLEPASALKVGGSDEEQALVAVLARSLVEGLEEVRRVGLLVDGEPRRTLAGHVDLERTFLGNEWPLAGERAGRSRRGDFPPYDDEEEPAAGMARLRAGR
jgi:hypothetical protein